MKRELTEKLLALYEAGYTIVIKGGYVDNNFHLYRADEDTLIENNDFHTELELDDVCFDSEVYSQFPLKNINTLDVTVFEPLADWKNFELV